MNAIVFPRAAPAGWAPAVKETGTTEAETTHRPPLLQAGDAVRVRSVAEILQTLDDHGRLDGLPFMPEMARLCGQEMRVYRRADRTCVEGVGLRQMSATVLLDQARCDGAAHDGCERGCLMFWKEAWLVGADSAPAAIDSAAEARALERLLTLPTRRQDSYICQSTELAGATGDLPNAPMKLLIGDLKARELSLIRFGEILFRTAINKVLAKLKAPPFGSLAGKDGKVVSDLKLQPGERVRIKGPAGIAATLDDCGNNRGLKFEPEMTPYAGGVYTVSGPVTKMIHEETGKMVRLKSTVALEGLTCEGRCTLNCPRASLLFWREAWLERVDEPKTT